MARGVVYKMNMKVFLKICTLVAGIAMAVGMGGCSDELRFTTDMRHRLEFSTDTVAFDTLFTDVSSATHAFLIYNLNGADMRIAHTALAGGEQSPYRINVDGLAGTAHDDLVLRRGDSMYVFVEVTIDPRGKDEPFEANDSVLFVLESGITQRVLLTATGQDATVMRGAVIAHDTHLTGARPYLIYDSLRVERGATLTMEPGTRLYMADGAELQVHGRIVAQGTPDSLIVMRGARTDRMFAYLPYDRLPAQWGGITLHEESTGNVFVHCDIHSGTYGLKAKGTDLTESKLTMHSSQIHNVNGDALELTMCRGQFTNSLFTNAGGHCVNILGGEMDFIHCTMANFFPWKSERGVALHIANYAEEERTIYPLMGVRFINSIITGAKPDELMGTIVTRTDTADYSSYAQVAFTHSVINSWREALNPDTARFKNIVWEHRDSTAYGRTNFRTIDHTNFVYDFHLDSLSVARRAASSEYITLIPNDKDGMARTAEGVDAGCYQFFRIEN